MLVALCGDVNSSVSKDLADNLFSFRFDDQPTFLGIREVTIGGPLSDSSSHHFFTSFREPLPVASSANQHCFAALETCSRVISG